MGKLLVVVPVESPRMSKASSDQISKKGISQIEKMENVQKDPLFIKINANEPRTWNLWTLFVSYVTAKFSSTEFPNGALEDW